MSWKEQLAKAYTTVPKSIAGLLWKAGTLAMAAAVGLTGIFLWRNPGLVMGKPKEEQSLIRRLAAHKEIKEKVYKLLEEFFYKYRPHGLALIAWEELNGVVGIWVQPADHFPEIAGMHPLAEELRPLVGEFIYGECNYTDSAHHGGYVLVACPINSSYDVWGYVQMYVLAGEEQESLKQLELLAHRITRLVY